MESHRIYRLEVSIRCFFMLILLKESENVSLVYIVDLFNIFELLTTFDIFIDFDWNTLSFLSHSLGQFL